ncbi:MAG: F0F1 ATP synthase subunit B [Jatrophihabitantaceae bacterium]
MAQHQTVLASSNFLVPNATFIAELLAFLLILFILGRYVLPPVQKAMRDRQAMIDQQVADAAEAKKQLAEAQDAYQRALAEARTEAAKIRESARAEAQHVVDDLRAQAQEESARIVARGEEQLDRQRGAIVRELRAEIGTLAVELSEKIVDQQLSDDARVSATVDAFLTGLEAQDAAHTQAGNQP